jgi:hypothetical protein
MNEIIQWVGLIRDIGLIVGVPTLIVVGAKLYSQQIEALKARNELLRETQYDRAVSLLESQKKVFFLERESLEKQIADLEKLRNDKDATISELAGGLKGIQTALRDVIRNSISLNEENLERMLIEIRKESPKNRTIGPG